MAEEMKPGEYVGLYIEDKLIHTGVLKDQGVMQSGRKIYQILLVKNIFQRNFPEIHFDADVRAVTWEQVQEEIKRLKIRLQKNIEKMEGEHVQELITEKELHNIIGGIGPAFRPVPRSIRPRSIRWYRCRMEWYSLGVNECTTECRIIRQSLNLYSGLQSITKVYLIMRQAVRQYGKVPNGRDEAIGVLKQLLDEYEKTYLGAKDESDEDYLSKFDDLGYQAETNPVVIETVVPGVSSLHVPELITEQLKI